MKDIYLRFSSPNLRGESRDKDHEGWIECIYYAHKIIQPRSVTASTAGGHTSERTRHKSMVFFKELDLASPRLWQYCSGGTTFQEVIVDFMRADGEGNRVRYMEIKLKNVIIDSTTSMVTEYGSMIEEFSLKYAAAQWTYAKQKIGGGQAGSVVGAWSLAKNDKTYQV